MSIPRRTVLWTLIPAALLVGVLPLVSRAEAPFEAPDATVPTPASVIGWLPCADYKLATYEQIADYFRALDEASPRMRLFEVGLTAEGRPQLMAVISSQANLDRLALWKALGRRLAMARDLTDEQARALALEGKAVIWINFGLHSDEVAHGQVAPLVAWKAVTDDSPEMERIRDNVIFILVPNMNPDGTTLVAEWYREHVGTPFEEAPTPTLYHKYVGHDNNRDWFMFNMPETRNIGRQLYHEWFPQVVYDHHQAGPFPARIFIPPFQAPTNPNIPPLVLRGIDEIAATMANRFARENKSGVVSGILYDTWWNGGMRSAPYYHNMVGILTEAQHDTATPGVYDPRFFPRSFSNGESTRTPSSSYPDPWPGGAWRLRDTCDYMMTASMAVLDAGARRRQEWLYGIYQMGRDAIREGALETYVIPAAQWDSNAAVKLVNVLRWGGVEVERATAPFSAGHQAYPAGSFLVRGAQPFRAYVTDLLNPQVYPDRGRDGGSAPPRPYDITGWTLPFQMGVKVDKLDVAPSVPTEPVTFAALPPTDIEGRGPAYAIDPRANEAFIAVNRLLGEGVRVDRATRAAVIGEPSWSPGAFLVEVERDRLEALTRDLGLSIRTWHGAPPVDRLRLRQPRIGLYQAWGGNPDEGWTRWLLEQFEFSFATLRDQDIRSGDLRRRFDVIVLPDASYDEMRFGLAPGTTPDQYAGGLTADGVANLHDFVRLGGTLIAMDSASELPIRAFGLPVREARRMWTGSPLSAPGSILRLTSDPSHPVAFGMPAESHAFFLESPAFELTDTAQRADREATGQLERVVVARYPDVDLLASGWIQGESVLHGRAAVLDLPVGDGRVVLLGFRAQHRGQPHGTFRLLFNSLLLAASDRLGP